MPDVKRVLLTGATGFVGRHLYPVLANAGLTVIGGSRDPAPARKRYPGRCFVRMDVMDFESTVAAMQGCDAAVYLVHSMADQRNYDSVERRSASNFARAAELAGLSRVVYLGGIKPSGKASRHLRSRLRTGELLRSGKVSTIELQAGIIIGAGSESWLIVRDLAARLPVMVLPRWLDSLSQPIAIDDVVSAIARALTIDVAGNPAYALPGPEALSARDIILRAADLLGRHPQVVRVPVLTRRLSSCWISLVTRANPRIARQLVDGLGTDLLAADLGFWKLMPEHVRLSFDEAARRALQAEAETLSLSSRLTEWLLQRVTWSDKRNPSEATL
jgi:uncharacterized protein YbjT (DUF2867 family)